ncbi:MAG: DUF393 domain-containing protein [Deltaproteobacteria bacterium]|nr:DUF393 domain-containing protein [Deltaproteobacteria bacterium]
MSPKLHIIYDGQCLFCIRVLNVVKKLDTFKGLDFYDSHDRDTMEKRFPMVSPQEAEEAMLAVTEEGEVFKGFYAFRRSFWKIPYLWLLALILYVPGIPYLGTRCYGWIARNRKTFGCRI